MHIDAAPLVEVIILESVVIKGIRDSAIRIAIRLALGEYHIMGPSNNVLKLESRVAWATVATELQNEGYIMVSPDEYADAYALTPAAVSEMIIQDGTLFALAYASAGKTFTLVPLVERDELEQLGPILE